MHKEFHKLCTVSNEAAKEISCKALWRNGRAATKLPQRTEDFYVYREGQTCGGLEWTVSLLSLFLVGGSVLVEDTRGVTTGRLWASTSDVVQSRKAEMRWQDMSFVLQRSQCTGTAIHAMVRSLCVSSFVKRQTLFNSAYAFVLHSGTRYR